MKKRGPKARLGGTTGRSLLSILAGGLLHRKVAGGAELGGDIDCSVVVHVNIPGAVGGPEDRKGTIYVGTAVIDPAHRNVPVRSELSRLTDYPVSIPADIPVARGRAEHGEVRNRVGSVGEARRPVIPGHRDVPGRAELGLDADDAAAKRVVHGDVAVAGGRPPDGNVGPEDSVVVSRNGDVAAGPELDGVVYSSVPVGVDIPGAVGRPEDRQIRDAAAEVVRPHGDVARRAELG